MPAMTLERLRNMTWTAALDDALPDHPDLLLLNEARQQVSTTKSTAPARGSLCFTALDYLEWETGKLPEETDLAVIQSLTIKPYPGGKGVATGRGALPSHNSFVIEPQKAHRYDNELYRERELD
jgi:hypothetical protein